MSDRPCAGFFITGTDTDIGKTYVCRVLADAFSKKMAVTYLKPVQTGCGKNRKGAPDFEYMLKGAIFRTAPYEVHVPYCFEPACSPHFAAKQSGLKIDFKRIKDCFKAVCKSPDKKPVFTFVEGAGGIFTPLDRSKFMLDLMVYLKLPVILVTTPALGTLNHTLLSLFALQQKSVNVAGIVMNNRHNIKKDFIYKSNAHFLRKAVYPRPFLEMDFKARNNPSIEKFCHELAKRFF